MKQKSIFDTGDEGGGLGSFEGLGGRWGVVWGRSVVGRERGVPPLKESNLYNASYNK